MNNLLNAQKEALLSEGFNFTDAEIQKLADVFEIEQQAARIEQLTAELNQIENKARAAGRAEAARIIMSLDPEDGIDDFFSQCLDTVRGYDDEYSSSWNETKLKEMFSVDDESYNRITAAEDKVFSIYWDFAAYKDGLQNDCPDLNVYRQKIESELGYQAIIKAAKFIPAIINHQHPVVAEVISILEIYANRIKSGEVQL
ncbi:Uncharacterised protein [Pragia fontium]|uniref:hypothetical protein n=1 Tax=Pragia fontium TaxID=82985 RepID=UPI000DFA2A9A|nr:hypothetical protein [Pragia fontium]SUB81990.1 Uncharacterised protein [Pragia fontium]